MSNPKSQTTPDKPKKSKQAMVLGLLNRKSGATIAQIAKATGWQAHSIRATLSRLRRQGVEIERDKSKGGSRYRIAATGKAA